MRAQTLTGLLAITLLLGSGTAALSGDKETPIGDLVKDAKITAE